MRRGMIVIGLGVALFGLSLSLAADHPDGSAHFELEGPVSVAAERLIGNARMGGTQYERILVSPDGSVSVTLANFLDPGPVQTHWRVTGYRHATGEVLWRNTSWGDHEWGEIRDGRMASDGTLYLAGQAEGYARIFALDSSSGEAVWERDAPAGQPVAVALSPDESILFVARRGAEPPSIALAYDAETGDELWQAETAESRVVPGWQVDIASDGQRLFLAGTGDEQWVLVCLDAFTGQELWRREVDLRVTRLAVAPEGGPVLLAGTGEIDVSEQALAMRAHDPASGEELWRVAETFEGAEQSNVADIAASLDGEFVYLAGNHAKREGDTSSFISFGDVNAYRADTGEAVWRKASQTDEESWASGNLAVCPDSGYLIWTGSQGATAFIKGVQAEDGVLCWSVARTQPSADWASGFGLAVGGDSIFALGGVARVLDFHYGATVLLFASTDVPESGTQELMGPVQNILERYWHPEDSSLHSVSASALSRDGDTLFIAGKTLADMASQALLLAFDTNKGTERWRLEKPENGEVTGLVLSEDGTIVVVAKYPSLTIAAYAADDGSHLWGAGFEDVEGPKAKLHLAEPPDADVVVAALPAADGGSVLRAFSIETGDLEWEFVHDEGGGFSRINGVFRYFDTLFLVGAGPDENGAESYLTTRNRSWSGEEFWRYRRSGEGGQATGWAFGGIRQIFTGLTPAGEVYEQVISAHRVHDEHPSWIMRLPRELPQRPELTATRHRLFTFALNSANGKDPLAEQWLSLHGLDRDTGELLWIREIEARGDLLEPAAQKLAPDGETLLTAYTRTALFTTVVVEGCRARTGEQLWRIEYVAPLRGQARVRDIHLGASSGALYITGEGRAGSGGPKLFVLEYRFDERAWGDSFDVWQSRHYSPEELRDGTIREPWGDAGGLGIPNLLRYAFGMEPRLPDRSSLPQAGRTTISVNGELEQFLSLRYKVRPDAVDLEYIPEASYDMTEWILVPVENIIRRRENPDGTQTVTIADWVPMGDAESNRRFMRLRVERLE